MGFSIGAFVGGFAEKAVEIEEQSAKIGVALLKEAMDDFREEAKDFKPKRLAELKNKKDQAKFLRGLFEKKGDTPGKHDAKIKVLLDGGDTVVQNFINKAEKARAFQNLDSVSSLITLGEGHAAATGSGFDLIDYIDSGVYATVNAPIYGGPEGMTTGVFGRDISLGGKAGSVDSIKSAYIPDAEKYTGDVPTSMGATVNLTSSLKRGAYKVPGRVAVNDYKKQFLKRLSDLAGVSTSIDNAGNFLFLEGKADVITRIGNDADAALKNYVNNYKNDDEEIDPLELQGFATSYAQMENKKDLANKVAEKDVFYKQVFNKQSIMDTGGPSKVAGNPAVITPAPAPAAGAYTAKSLQADQNFRTEVTTLQNNVNLPNFKKRKALSAIAQAAPYSLPKQEADTLAEAELP